MRARLIRARMHRNPESNEYLLRGIQRTRYSLVPGVGAGDVTLMLATVPPALPHCHAAEPLLALNEVHAVAAVRHIFHLKTSRILFRSKENRFAG